MRPQSKRKLIAGLVSAVAAASLALSSLTALAVAAPNPGPGSDGPQSANIPYVAWVGEHVRLVACDPAINTSEDEGQLVNSQLEDWSGRPEAAELPAPDAGSSAFFAPSEGSGQASIGAGCVKIDYKSLNPGLARIRAVVTNAAGAIVFSHQFLVIWLTLNKPTLSELPYGGDPSGNGEFVPSPFSEPESNTDKGLVQVKVTGSFPVEPGSALHNLLPEPSYTLPESWPTLAAKLATSTEELEPEGTNPGLWDIHGSPEASPTTGAFGPFDPEAAETLLSNGSLNADDAPMPAIRIDVHLAPNEGGSSLGGVGRISGASKAQVYTDNPYYGAYIPATDRPVPQASGVDGPSPGGDFPAFLNKHPEPYTFWTSVHSSGERYAESTGCLRRNFGNAEGPVYYQTPSGSLNETFYTDERGEVLVSYTPGDGFYLNHLPVFGGAEGESEAGKIVKNADGGCDLKNLYKEVIGESSISATAVYPYQSVDYGPQATEGPVVKKVRSMWEKEFFSFPKGPGPNEQNVRIVVAKAQDIDGNPVADEMVCFHAQQEAGIYSFRGELSDPGRQLGQGAEVDLNGSWVRDPADEGTSRLCETTNRQGLAGIELVNSTSASVDLTARYECEGIIRDHLVDFPGNIGAKEKKEAEEKAAAEKKAAEEKVAAERKAAEEKAAAERKAAEEQAAAEREEAEDKQAAKEIAAEEARQKREEAAEKRQHEREAAKEAAEKKTAEEIAAADKVRAEEEAATKKRNEEELARRKSEIEALSKLAATLLPGALTGSPAAPADPPTGQTGPTAVQVTGNKAHTAAKHGKKAKKHKKRKKK
jgi:hypothetical protein